MSEDNFCGIGIRLNPLSTDVEIEQVGKNSPAQKIGLHSGDVILAVRQHDGEEWVPVNSHNHAEYIRGPVGSKIDLLVKDPVTGKQHELDGVPRAGIDENTLAPIEGLTCDAPISLLEPHPGNLPFRPGARARQVG